MNGIRKRTRYHGGFETFHFIFGLSIAFDFFLNSFGNSGKWTGNRTSGRNGFDRWHSLSFLLFPEFIRWNQVISATFGWMSTIVCRCRFIHFFNFYSIEFKILAITRQYRKKKERFNVFTRTSCANA